MIRRILVGVDGSANSLGALNWTIALAQQTNAEVMAVHAMGLKPIEEDGKFLSPEEARHITAELLDSVWCAPLKNSGVKHQNLLIEGSPVSALLEIAGELAVDLIVVGTRGHSLGEASIGSTAHRIIEESKTPVVVLPPRPADE
ncbi:MAG: universal stress protein [Acidimicrobiaceae bacterium]|nr:universal stress protein [Acidimicrobiaceae bacterium]